MDETTLTASVDGRLAAARRKLQDLETERASLVAQTQTAPPVPWHVEIGLISDYEGRSHRLPVAGRLFGLANVWAHVLGDEATGLPSTLFMTVEVSATDEITAAAMAKGMIIAAGGDPDFWHYELGPDWDISPMGPATDAASFAWRHEGSVRITNARAQEILAAWQARFES